MKTRAALVSNIYWNYGRNARKRGFDFLLSREEFEALIFEDCYLCGTGPANTKTCSRTKNSLQYNGIDRIRNTEGYTTDNVQTCCWQCNLVKGQLELPDLKNHLTKMMKKLKDVV